MSYLVRCISGKTDDWWWWWHRVLKMNEDTGLELLLKDILRKQEIEKVEDLEILEDKLS